MTKASKIIPIVVLLITSFSLLAQERTVGTEENATSQQMMTNANNSDQIAPALMGVTSVARIQELEGSIEGLRQKNAALRQELENAPHYLDQTGHSLWP
jgi:hypothetical protein